MANNGSGKKDDYSAEIIALLKDVGDRLLRNEQERIHLRDTLEDLENRFDQNENVFLSVHDRLSKTETAFSKRQDAIEALQIEQSVKLEKAAMMADKIEEAMAQHANLNSRLEQEAQDKILILRQLEKIEDTVIETQTALRETALVPVGRYQKSGLPLGMKAKPAPFSMSSFVPGSALRVAGVVAVIALGVFGGWALHSVSGSSLMMAAQDKTAQDKTVMPAPVQITHHNAKAAAGGLEHDRAEIRDYAYGDMERTPMDNTYDVLDMDDAQLIAAWEADQQALAEQLNRIEPVSGHVMPENLDDSGRAHAPQNDNSHKAAFVQPDNTPIVSGLIKTVDAQDFITAQKQDGALRDRIKPDTALPAIIKDVEAQAYKNIAEAQHDLAAIYTAGHGGVPVDFERAAQWFREAAINGVANARYNLGVLYHQGLGVDQDITMAVNWYRAAAQTGHPEAQYNLGIAYIEGIGTEYSPDHAAYYFEQAAIGGVLEAAYNLGLIHENGLIGQSRPDEAVFWYKYAADLGSAEAQEALGQLTAVMGYQPADIDRIYKAHATLQKSGQAENKAGGNKAGQNKAGQSNHAAVKQQGDDARAQTITAGGLNDGDTASLSDAGGDVYDSGFNPDRHVPNLAAQNDDRAFKSRVAAVDAATVAQLQEQLVRLGLYPGPSDGVYNSITEDAIRAYQAEFALTPDGRPTQALLVHMMTNDFDNREYGSREE